MVKLTEEQMEHYKTIKWLLIGPTRSGRTQVLATALVEFALHNRKLRIYAIDHIMFITRNKQVTHHLFNRIAGIVADLPEQQREHFKYNITEGWFMYDL